MNRISRRSATEAADALLEVGRTQPVLHYDVDLGLARHRQWLRNNAPMPDWAGAGAGATAKSAVPAVIKTVVSLALIGAGAAWYAYGGQQPTAADVTAPPPVASRTRPIVPSVGTVTTADDRPATRPIPIPIPDLSPSSDEDEYEDESEPVDRTVRADLHDKHRTRPHRARKARASARAAAVRPAPRARPAAKPTAPVEPATPATTQPSEDERTIGHDLAAAQEPKRASAAHSIAPEPKPKGHAQVPDDLLEMQQVATAEQLLERSPARALALVRQGDRRFADGYFQQERAYIAIMALIRLGRVEEARTRAAFFAKHFPPLPFGARIRSALEGGQVPASGAASPNASP